MTKAKKVGKSLENRHLCNLACFDNHYSITLTLYTVSEVRENWNCRKAIVDYEKKKG